MYDARIRPAGENTKGTRNNFCYISTEKTFSMVYVNVFIRSLSKIDDVKW